MPILVHLCPEAAVAKILRRGIRAERLREPCARGVFAMPQLSSFYATHQWLRELKRRGQRTIVAVDFRVPSREEVWVGHYRQPQNLATAGEAIRVIREQADPRGYQLILPRSVAAKEVVGIRSVPQVVGWRFYPEAKGARPCACEYCQRGEIKGRRIRTRLGA